MITTETIREQELNRRVAKQPFSNIQEVAEFIAGEARQRGFTVEPMLQGRPTVLRKRMLLINEKECSLAHATGCRFQGPRARRPYSHHILGRSPLEVAKYKVILQETVLGISHLWIVPTADLLLFLGNAERRTIYLPIYRRARYRGLPPLFDWWPYEDAWQHLD